MEPESKASKALRVAIDNYRSSVTAYHEFLALTNPVLDELPTKRDAAFATELDNMVREFKTEASREEVKQFAAVLRAMVPLPDEPAEQPPASEAHAQIDLLLDGTETISPRVGKAVQRLARAVRASVGAGLHREILYRGVLTGIVGQFEVLIADLAHHFYSRAPGSLGNQDKVLSVSELLSFGNLEEAIEYVIADKVDDLLRGSADDWAKFFASRLKIDVPSVALDWSRFVEYIQRRHLIVHAGSRISRRYLKNVDPELVKEYFERPQVGDAVHLTNEYVNSALDTFEATGLLLGFVCWVKLHASHSDEQVSLLDNYVYETMLAGRWRVALHMAAWGAEQPSFDAGTKLTFRVNAWLALKRLGRFEECASDVRSFDASAVRTVFSIARAALLDQFEELFELIEEDEGASLDERAWSEWPLLDEARTQPRFEDLRKRFAASARTRREEPERSGATAIGLLGSPDAASSAPEVGDAG